MESPNAVSCLVFHKTEGMSKVALFMRMKFVIRDPLHQIQEAPALYQHNILTYDTACKIFIIAPHPQSSFSAGLNFHVYIYSYQLPKCNRSDKINNKLVAIQALILVFFIGGRPLSRIHKCQGQSHDWSRDALLVHLFSRRYLGEKSPISRREIGEKSL